MTQLFGRAGAVTVGTTRVSGLRFAFSVERSLEPEPNRGTAQIWNLSESSRGRFERDGLTMSIEAGYGDDAEELFVGDVTEVSHVRDGPSWITEVEGGDGVKAVQTARTNRSFAPGAAIRDVVEAVAKDLGVGIGNVVEKAKRGDITGALTELTHGIVFSGDVPTQLSKILRSLGLTYSIQDGQLQLLGPDDVRAGAADVLSPSTGLLGSPTKGENGIVTARSLLRPRLRPGNKVQIVAAQVSGFYRVERARHVGDTEGADWTTEIEGKPL